MGYNLMVALIIYIYMLSWFISSYDLVNKANDLYFAEIWYHYKTKQIYYSHLAQIKAFIFHTTSFIIHILIFYHQTVYYKIMYN